MAGEVVYYKISQHGNTTVVKCPQTVVATLVQQDNLQKEVNSWQFLRILDIANAYHIKNHGGVYLYVENINTGENIKGGGILSSNTVWIIESIPPTPTDPAPQYKIKLNGTSLYMKVSGVNIVLDNEASASVWDILIHSGIPPLT